MVEIYPKSVKRKIETCELQIDDYTFYVNAASKRGCIIYVKNRLVSSSHPISSSDYEEIVGCYIHLQRGDKLSVVCVYRSTNSSNMNNAKLLTLIDQVTEENSSHILLLGDFN